MGGKSSKEPPKDLRPAFDVYIEKVGKDGFLTRTGFKTWLNEAFIIGEDSGVNVVEIEKVLSANVGEKNNLNFEQFKKCIDDLVKKKNLDRAELIDQLISASQVHNIKMN